MRDEWERALCHWPCDGVSLLWRLHVYRILSLNSIACTQNRIQALRVLLQAGRVDGTQSKQHQCVRQSSMLGCSGTLRMWTRMLQSTINLCSCNK